MTERAVDCGEFPFVMVIVEDRRLEEDEVDRAVVLAVIGTVMRLDGSGSLNRILKPKVKGLLAQHSMHDQTVSMLSR